METESVEAHEPERITISHLFVHVILLPLYSLYMVMGFIKIFTHKHIVYLDYIYTYVRHVQSLYFHTCTLHVLTLFAHVFSFLSLHLPFHIRRQFWFCFKDMYKWVTIAHYSSTCIKKKMTSLILCVYWVCTGFSLWCSLGSSEDNFQKPLSFYHVGPRNQSKAVRLGNSPSTCWAISLSQENSFLLKCIQWVFYYY